MNFLESPEVRKFLLEVATHPIEITASTAALIFFAMCFSRKSKRTMERRSKRNHNGVLSDELTHEPIDHGEAAHFDHTRNDSYDDPENGVYVAPKTHLWMHEVDEDNGLTKEQNAYAIRELKKRVNGNKG